MEGDAFSKAKLGKLSEDDRSVIASAFEDNGFEQTAESVRSSVSVFRPFYNFLEEEVMQG